MQRFWPAVVFAIATYEVFSVFTFERPYDMYYSGAGGLWSIRSDHLPGDLRFDPLSLKPRDPEGQKNMETKELVRPRDAGVRRVVLELIRYRNVRIAP